MANKITNTEHYAAIANAIRSKNGETDTYTPAEMADAIGRIPKGGGGASENDVNFYDYDGSIVASYTAAQFAALEEMPENPDHIDEGLTSQGWNWSLADAKSYVASYGKLNIGQMYVPTDGKTHVFINIPEDAPSYETTLYFGHTTASGQTVVDWGDGSPTETFSGTSAAQHSHTYARPGQYEITLDTVSGIMSILGTNTSRTGIRFCGAGNYARNLSRIKKICFSTKVNIGNNAFFYCYTLQKITIPYGVTSIGNSAFNSCYALQSVTIPESVTSIGNSAFGYCYSLQSVTIPESVTSIGNSAFDNCDDLQSVTIPESVTRIGDSVFNNCKTMQSVTIPESVTSIGNSAFNYCYNLQSVTLPEGVTSIGNSAFSSCYTLQKITIPYGVTSIGATAFSYCYALQSVTIPNSVTDIGDNVFYYCYNLQSVTLPEGVTSIGNYAFYYCFDLQSIVIPDSVTKIGNYAFYYCYTLQSVTIPDSVTDIGTNVFYACYALQSVTLPEGVTKIGVSTFYNCYSVSAYHLNPTTPPTLSNTATFNNIPTDTVFYVPAESLEAYKTATNWSTYADRMVAEPE